MDAPNVADLLTAVRSAARDTEMAASLREILRQAEEAVLRVAPSCRACGACCDFALREHQLFLTTGELALLAEQPPPQPPAKGRCPYQVQGRCTARDRRPLGCRIYFCRTDGRDAREDLYRNFHARLAALHEERGIPYCYAEMTSWLEAYHGARKEETFSGSETAAAEVELAPSEADRAGKGP